MFRRLKERWQLKQSESASTDQVQNEFDTEATREPVPHLPADILDYWHKVLIEDDLDSLQAADVRIPLKNFAQLARPGFNLGFGKRPEQALKFITARVAEAELKRKADEGEPSDDESTTVLSCTSVDALAEKPLTCQRNEPRIPMALVFHETTEPNVQVTWPDPNQKPDGDGKENKRRLAKLNIAFWFPFELNDKNEICISRDPTDRRPRIIRRWLEPQPLIASKYLPPALGHLDFYRKALKSFFSTMSEDANLKTYVDACFELFSQVQADGSATGMAAISGQWIAVPRQPGYATLALSNVYKALPQAKSLGALGQLIELGRYRTSVQVDAPAQPSVIARHLAMVDKAEKPEAPDVLRSADPLNDSQRRSLQALVGLAGDAGVIAVSGPPGTGKTAMLRAMIANQWVLAAYEKAEHCPVTFVCGSTNQSVENVMGTFDGAVGRKHPLARRWLDPKGKPLLGFTASAPSKAKIKSQRKKFTTLEIVQKQLQINGVGSACTELPLAAHSTVALSLARHFEHAFSECQALFSVLFTLKQKHQVSECTRQLRLIEKAQQAATKEAPTATPADDAPSRERILEYLGTLAELLHSGLREAVDRQGRMDDSLDRAGLQAFFPSEGWSSKWAELALDELHQAASVDSCLAARQKLLDVVWRPVIFQLAARYWEVRWLSSVIDAPISMTRREELRRAAMLFPCIVSTLHSAPRLLTERRQPLFAFLDLLIIDEAGQAAPELGVPILSLARKAVIVGDMKQLSPVSSITPEVEARQVLDRWGNQALLADLQARGADAATGSIMKLAATGASRAEVMPDGKQRDGLLLREHYRCAESIINVCIDLLYHEHDWDTQGNLLNRELVPMIPDPRPGQLEDAELPLLEAEEEQALLKRMKGTFPLPPLGFYQTGGPNDEPVKQDSWSNPGEVKAIVQWLKDTGQQLAKWVARSEGNADQSVGLEKLIAIVTPFRGQANAIREEIRKELDPLDEGLSKRMTIGTVHTLQGAEKPVVLFSAVNKESTAACRTDDNHRERVFIDRDDGRLLNVAISRAQKSFILFGHSDLFFSQQAMNPSNDLPSAIFGRCLVGVEDAARERITGAPRIPARKLGPTTLMVVESPHKATIIQELLPLDTQVFGSGGHIRELPGAGSIRWEDGLLPRWRLSERECRDLSDALRNTANRLLQCDELVLGTDDDAQGEAIAWHIVQVLKDAPWFMHVKRVRRVRFHALTEPEMARAFTEGTVVGLEGETAEQRAASACRALNMGLAYAAIASRVLDNLIGSVYLRHGIPRGGRVKGPLLRALAGYGDSPETPDKRYGVAIELQVNGQSVPARLMVLRGNGSWRPWGSDRMDDAQRLLAVLPNAVVGPEPCLFEREIRHLPPAETLSTNLVLQEAFRRFGWTPSKTTKALQGLYELRAVADEPAPTTIDTGGWATLDSVGRLRLTEIGKTQAKKLLKNPWLETISANGLLREFDEALNCLSLQTFAQEEDYVKFLDTWAQRFDDQRNSQFPTVPIGSPNGDTVDGQGNAVALFTNQPSVKVSRWIPSSARQLTKPAVEVEVPGVVEPSQESIESPPAGARSGAHGALVPLDIVVDAESPQMAAFSAHQRQLYELMSKLTLASALRDGEMNVIRRIYPLNWPDKASLKKVEIGIEVLTATDGVYRGWFNMDPDGLKKHAATWAGAEVEHLLSADPPPALRVTVGDDAICTRSLLDPTVDSLLAWMETRRHGRPSTFGKHIEDLLTGSGRETKEDGIADE